MSDKRINANRFLLAVILAMTAVLCGSARAEEIPGKVSKELRGKAVGVLRQTLDQEHRWVKVHAAEFLLKLDYPQGVAEVFGKELAEFENEPEYRVGVWRVLARAAENDEQRTRWTEKIRGVFLDEDALDRTHAVETLSKLGYTIRREGDEPFERDARPDTGLSAMFARWVLANSGDEEAILRLAEPLESDDTDTRKVAAYALRHLPDVPPTVCDKLAAAAQHEPADSAARVYIICAAAVHALPEQKTTLKAELVKYAETGAEVEKYHACETLAQIGTDDDLPLLIRLLEDDGTDVRATAAYAILRIGRRDHHRFGLIDWGVIAVYALGMIAVGWYYSRRTATTDDYLLGGRKMNPFNVGLSLFATLLSTISYLSFPGEMIKYGPIIILGTIASYPFVALVVGWFIIPFIMKLKVTSAYEILETRLGLGVRILGSVFFLSLRLLWMAVIIYATVDKVLVPLLGLNPSATPYLCAVLGLITVIYTSMGGLRAVVLTDVIQTFILFGGAILTIVLITITMGGVGAWWPTQWAANWPEPVWGYDPNVRGTFLGAMIAMFVWWVCTCGSDQMAIQRYLATRDVKAARNVLITSLTASATVLMLLGILGLALLAFFRMNPYLLPDGQAIFSDADQLFPRFIVIGLPVGISGLVVAGLLAAAMSSLSSGINSSCSVITVDFIDRFRNRKNKQVETDHVRLAKYVSVIVGIVVVVLSAYVGVVEGNLLEIAYKVVNLLTAPLFGLFFMAMFVRWATGFGTIVGAAFGLATVVAVNFWEEMTGTKGISFLWAMPLGLLVQVLVGSIASLVPIGRR